MTRSDRADSGVLRATVVGASALAMWSASALFAMGAREIPSFQLVTLCFSVAFLLALGRWLVRGESVVPYLRLSQRAWLIGIGGLFGYHLLYFFALRMAPPVQVNLLNFLWPLFVVMLSALLPGERLRWWHVAGSLLGLAGAAILVTGGGRVAIQPEHAWGYVMALAGALTWGLYSLASRRYMAHVPTDAVGGFCLGTALLALACHFAVEIWVWPTPGEWLAILALGLGPAGGAFFAWDYGVKHGDIRSLGGLSYGVPLLSTVLLAIFGFAEPSVSIAVACILIAGGAVLASRDLWRGRA
ncbi:MAG: DMT family transporter [Alphaproteobacteria bacterium]